jgi:hypothetical protein
MHSGEPDPIFPALRRPEGAWKTSMKTLPPLQFGGDHHGAQRSWATGPGSRSRASPADDYPFQEGAS